MRPPRTKFEDHPTVQAVRRSDARRESPRTLDADWLRQACLDAGADDVGFVEIDRAELDDQRQDLEAALPGVRTLVSIVVRMNRENIRSPARSVANLEFHHSGDAIDATARRVVSRLEEQGVRASNPAMGFPMEMDRFPSKMWVVSHKPVAVAAGLGQMGLHRNVIHPRFGNFVLLGTILVAAEVQETSTPLSYNPCVECRLCVTACPTGAIASDGHFDFSACFTHNYREFMGGFTDWVETVTDSSGARDYRARVPDSETASIWQSLSFGANYKAAYCMSVCPAGEDVLGSWLEDRKAHLEQVVEPLTDKVETVYVVPGSDAEQHVAATFPAKRVSHVGQSLRPQTVDGFVEGLPLVFQRRRAEGLYATFHFTFSGNAEREVTVVIRGGELEVLEGHHGRPTLSVAADAEAWMRFLDRRSTLPLALITRRIRLRGSPRHLRSFDRCFA